VCAWDGHFTWIEFYGFLAIVAVCSVSILFPRYPCLFLPGVPLCPPAFAFISLSALLSRRRCFFAPIALFPPLLLFRRYWSFHFSPVITLNFSSRPFRAVHGFVVFDSSGPGLFDFLIPLPLFFLRQRRYVGSHPLILSSAFSTFSFVMCIAGYRGGSHAVFALEFRFVVRSNSVLRCVLIAPFLPPLLCINVGSVVFGGFVRQIRRLGLRFLPSLFVRRLLRLLRRPVFPCCVRHLRLSRLLCFHSRR
jgi:hypothetical protein